MEIKAWIIALLLSALGVLAPIKIIMTAVGVLIVIDLILGIWNAKHKGHKISSSKMKRSVSKMFLYQLAILSGFMLELVGLGAFVPVSKLVASAISLVELKSIFENFEGITGINLWEKLKDKLTQKDSVK